jgi:hypothetical protein
MNTNNDLFPGTFSPSPRLIWRQAHGVHVGYHPNKDGRLEWRGRIGLSQVLADSEDEAEFLLCEKHNLTHYSLTK